MKLPAKLSAALAVAITAAIALAQEIQMPHVWHQVVVIVGGLVLALLPNPAQTVVKSSTSAVLDDVKNILQSPVAVHFLNGFGVELAFRQHPVDDDQPVS